MISGKIVKAFAWIIMIIFDLIAVCLLIAGAFRMGDIVGAILFGSGMLLPLIIGVMLYPMVALASIDENVKEMNQKYDSVLRILRANRNKSCDDNNDSPIYHESTKTQVLTTEVNLNQHLDLIKYVNVKYNLDITSEDSIEILKNKIESIEEKGSSVQVLKKKIAELNTIESILLAIQIHKTIND